MLKTVDGGYCNVLSRVLPCLAKKNSGRPAAFRIRLAEKEFFALGTGAFNPLGRDLLRIAMRRPGFFEDVDVEDAIGLGRVRGFGFDGVEDPRVDID